MKGSVSSQSTFQAGDNSIEHANFAAGEDEFVYALEEYKNQDLDTDMPVYQKLAIGALWLAYSIAAIVHDVHMAKAIIIANILMGVVAGVVLLMKWSAFQMYLANLETVVMDKWESKRNQYVGWFLCAIAFVLFIVLGSGFQKQRLVSGLGLIVFTVIAYGLSWNRSAIVWRPVVWGFVLQVIFGLIVLKTNIGFQIFDFVGDQMTTLIGHTRHGTEFVFGYLASGMVQDGGKVVMELPKVFAFFVLPTIIFFSSLVSILYYLGVLQRIIHVIGSGMAYIMGTSIAESLNAGANIFVGQTEAPLLIKPFLKDMTKSEIHAVMTGGFATIAGSVMAVFISFGISATHLVAASVMSAPAALAVSKMIYPETEEPKTQRGKAYKIEKGSETNVIEAAANGAAEAVGLVANIGGMLIAFISIIAMLDSWVGYLGIRVGWEAASFSSICGYLFYPFAWLMGIHPDDCLQIGELLGKKVFLNEMIAYQELEHIRNSLQARSFLIATYALCGFANFGSIGIQLGSLIALVPNRRKDFVRLVFSAMIAGNLVCFMTACIAGVLCN